MKACLKAIFPVTFLLAASAWALDKTTPEIVERKDHGWWESKYYKPDTNGAERAYRPYAFDETIDWTWPEVKDVGPGTKLLCLSTTAPKYLNKIYVVRVDLTTPGINLIGPIRCRDVWGQPMTDVDTASNAYTLREKTEDFMRRSRGTGSSLARNRDVFLAMNSAAWGPWNTSADQSSTYGNPNCPLWSLGVQVSSTGTGYGSHSSSGDQRGIFVFYKDRTADFVPRITTELAKKVWFSLPCFVRPLLQNGAIHPCAITGDYAQRNTIGLSQDRKTLFFVLCDGRDETWGKGLDFDQLARVHLAAGGWDAINLDGGGSTTLMTWDAERGMPYMHNWQTSTRRNGSNAGLYVKLPEVKAGTYLYDDLESALRDVQEGKLPTGVTELDVIRDASFSENCPNFPEGITVTLSSTNGSALGWPDGQAPSLPANAHVTLKGVALRGNVRTLTVGAGGSVTVDGALGLAGVRTADKDGFVLGGSLGDALVVDCAAARTAGATFGTSSLSLADTRAELDKIVCATAPELIAKAVESAGVVTLKWGRTDDWFSADLTTGAVSGGRWTETDETNRVFQADVSAQRIVRCVTQAAFPGACTARQLARRVAFEIQGHSSYPH